MALLDVSDVLTDPDFSDALTVYRSTIAVGDNGRTTKTTAALPIVGVVTQGGGDILDRTGDAEKIRGSITVHTMFILSAGGGGIDADELDWQGRRYVVDNVSDWSNYGAGFSSAGCTLKPMNA